MTNRAEFSNGVKEWFIRRRSHRREIDVGLAGNGEGSYQKRFRSVWIALTGEGLPCGVMKYTPQGKGEGSFEIGAWNLFGILYHFSAVKIPPCLPFPSGPEAKGRRC